MSSTFSTLRSIHSASAACMRARRARGIPAYAASRVNACLIACSRSSGKREPVRRRMKSRSSSSAKSASPPISSRTGASQNTRPITDAACSAAFSRGGSRSMRAARTPRTESGIESRSGSAATSHRSSRCTRTPLSTSDSISSSTKNGLPSERRTSTSRTSSGRSATSSAAASSASGSSSITVTFRRPPPQSSSGLAVATTRSGPRTSRTVRSSSSSSGASAQWTSSTSRTTGPSRARLGQEVDPGIAKAVARRQRVQVDADVAAEREAEDRPIVERAGLLLKDLPDRPVGPRRPVREAPADAERRALHASLEPRPELAQEAALAHAGVAEDDRELRLAVLDRTFVGAAEGVELVTPSDERPLVSAAGPDRRQRTDEQAARDAARSFPSRRRAAARRTRTRPWPPARFARPRRSGRVPLPARGERTTFTASPVTNELCASASTTTSPVFTPIRSASDGSSSGRRSRIASAAWSARSAWSSSAAGAPNAAITASPANFSTVPPTRSTSSAIAAKNRSSRTRTDSGSASPIVVEPTRSAKSTVATFRSTGGLSLS